MQQGTPSRLVYCNKNRNLQLVRQVRELHGKVAESACKVAGTNAQWEEWLDMVPTSPAYAAFLDQQMQVRLLHYTRLDYGN